jgi:hypothetical protein
MEDGDDKLNSWTLWGKRYLQRGDKECEIGGADISYLGIDV